MKPIPSCPNFFATADGEIYNSRRMKMRTHVASGYERVSLKNLAGQRVGFNVHRLVYEACIGPIPPKMWINHKDGNKLNNSLKNLEITTPSQNHCHARDVLKRSYSKGEKVHTAALNAESVEAVHFLFAQGWSQQKISRAFLVSAPSISNVINGKTWKHSS